MSTEESDTTTNDGTSTSSIVIKVYFFASAREACGNLNEIELKFDTKNTSITDDDETKDHPKTTTTTTTIITTTTIRNRLAELFPNVAQLILDENSITLALNEEYVPSGTEIRLKDGDTIALIPPISGG